MTNLKKGLAVALVHVLIVLSLGGKLLYDRSTRPRVWVRTGQVDPDLPIRGRYLTLNLQVRSAETYPVQSDPNFVELAVDNGQLVAHRSEKPTGLTLGRWRADASGNNVYMLIPSVAFFVPEHAELPPMTRGDELWAEVTVPKKGPPRPIQLAWKHGGAWTPLNYR